MRTFQIAKVPDVVYRSIYAADFKGLLAGPGQRDALLKQRIENDAASSVSFAPNAEVARELFTQNITGLRVGLDGKAKRGRRSRVHRALDPFAKVFAQHAADDGQF